VKKEKYEAFESYMWDDETGERLLLSRVEFDKTLPYEEAFKKARRELRRKDREGGFVWPKGFWPKAGEVTTDA